MKRAAILHTTPVTMAPLKAIADSIMPDIEIMNIFDDTLLRDSIKNGKPDSAVSARILYYIKCAEAAGSSAFMTACSSIGEPVEQCRFLTSLPVLRIDEAMAEKAVESGTQIGVVATVETTLNPTANIIERKAAEYGRKINIKRTLSQEAYKALIGGEPEKHDQIISQNLKELMDSCDVIVLAQASMARVIPSLGDVKVPILTSPEMGMRRLKEVLER